MCRTCDSRLPTTNFPTLPADSTSSTVTSCSSAYRCARGLPILSRLVDKVRPGGGFHVRFSIRTDSLASRSVWWASHHIPGVEIWQNIRSGRDWNAPAMQMNNLPLNRIVVRLVGQGVLRVFLLGGAAREVSDLQPVRKEARRGRLNGGVSQFVDHSFASRDAHSELSHRHLAPGRLPAGQGRDSTARSPACPSR